VPSLRRLAALIAVGVLALAVGACGEEEPSPAAPGQAEARAEAPPDGVEVADAADLTSKPTIRVREGIEPPAQLVVRDLVPGDGPVLRAGSQVTVQYVGVAWSDGEQFDASWGRGQPFQLALGAGSVIPGWDRGLVGMRVGGRRLLVIPPELGYGPQGQPPDIGPNETLVFVVDARRAS
jgi:peptidylprolyl isomerase